MAEESTVPIVRQSLDQEEECVPLVDEQLVSQPKKRRGDVWIVEGKAYDLSEFVKRHPGGREALLLGKGLDITELFKTYHLMRSPPESLLKNYKVDDSEVDCSFPTSDRFTFEENGFYMTIKKRVKEYFISTNQSPKASMFWQVLCFLCLFAIIGLMYPAFVMGSVIAAIAHGFLKGITAVGAGHCMSHFSLFSWTRLNSLMFRICAPLVISTHEIWSTSHVVSHHIHTLTADDLQDNYPVKRVQPALPWRPWHRFQHFYIWIVYIFGLPLWTGQDFFKTIPTLFTGKHEMRQLPIISRVENFVVIGLNIVLTIFFPFFFLPFWNALAVTLCSNVISSLMLVIQIAVNHEVPETMSKVDPHKKLDWGEHQVLTSHNFGVGSAFALHFSGGLNMQIEHHLFPSVHYTHYPAIGKIVKEACKEFGLPYNTSAHLFEAAYKHYQLLAYCSKPEH